MTTLADDQARTRIRTDLATTLVVEAAAGTGKTTELVARVLALVLTGTTTLAKIVAVTFTEKAAGEMKLRLREKIEEARGEKGRTSEESARLDRALCELEEARISTIHGFCADLLREWPVEARVDPLFEVAAEEEHERLFDEAFESFFQSVLNDPPEGIRRVLRRPQGRGHGPRQQLRAAGSDLVRQRDFDGAYRRDPFDRESALDDAIEKLELVGLLHLRASDPSDYLARNLHEIDAKIREIRRREELRAKTAGKKRDYDWVEAELRALQKARSFRWTGGRRTLFGKTLPRADVLRQRDEAKRTLDDVLARCDADLAACLREELRPLVDAFESLKTLAGKLDFLDLLLKTRDLLRSDANVRRELRARFTHFLVDEFQDTDPIQAEILFLLAASDEREDDWTRVTPVPGKLFLVGDPKQSIYRFRRADVALYESIKRRLVECGASVVHLTTSFRSAPGIQRLVNAAFSHAMLASDDGSQAAYVPLSPFRADPGVRPSVVALPVPRPYGDLGKVVRWKIEESLPDAVGAFVDWLLRDSGWTIDERDGAAVPIAARHVCLLFRRLQSFGEDVTRGYVRALEARAIPHVLVGGRSYHEREEVIALRNALRAIEWPDDELSVYATLKGPFFAIADDVLLAFRSAHGPLSPMRRIPDETLLPVHREVATALALLATLHRRRNRRPIADTIVALLGAVRAHAGVAIWPGGEQSLANLLRMLDLARRFEAAGATSFRAFVERIDEEAEARGAAEAPVVEESTDGVRIMTVHRAKGLEFPVVVLVDPTAPEVNDKPSCYVDVEKRLWAMPLAGASPIELLEREEEVRKRDRDEAVRLAYVAATRARDLLVLPVVGDPLDEPLGGWLDVLTGKPGEPSPLLPAAAERRRPRAATGCPPFGEDSVLDRGPEPKVGRDASIAPGLHRAERGGHDVVVWDPFVLALGKEPDHGLRQEKLLAADRTRVAEGASIRAHDDWQKARHDLLLRGAVETLHVETVTARAKTTRPTAPIEHARVDGRLASRPRGNRFGSLVHAVLSEAPLAGDASLVRLVHKHGRLLGATDEERLAAEMACEDALRHPLLRAAAEAEKRGACRREVPLAEVLEDGTLLEGVVDLAFEDGGGWVVVDYKTDAGEVAAGGVYDAQIGMYVRAIARATGAPARGVLLKV